KIIICALVFVLFLTACSNSGFPENSSEHSSETEFSEAEVFNVAPTPIYVNDTEITESGIYSLGSRLIYYSLQMLLEPTLTIWEGEEFYEDFSADLVVIGEFTEEAKERFNYEYNEYFEKEVKIGAVSYNQFLISDVLKNNDNGDIKIGNTITIGQNYAFDEETGAYMSFSNLTPMHKGDRWIYFLSHNKDTDTYYSVSGPCGRYPVPGRGIGQVMEEVIKEFSKLDEFLSDKKMDITWSEFIKINGGRILGYYDKRAEYFYTTHKRMGNPEAVYRLTIEEVDEWDKMRYNASFEIPRKIETSALGVLDRSEFRFLIYADILDHFQIKSDDEWVNPGRAFDARLVELAEGG
ncbi:MAG: hypothetical protein FWH07_02780, partial [Oscillospiraceae bacterium]|nr:hypothetical protein [Oscillospiraceae bacterium]